MNPSRIVLILPCCIGDVILATATLKALRRGYPDAHITWAVGSWSRTAVENHDLLDAILDTGPSALPVKSASKFLHFVRQLRAGHFDLAVSLVRSPLMSLAVWLSGVPLRAGLDSGGRGFGYQIRAKVDPDQPRHEAEIYLDVARALGLDATGCYANVPVTAENRALIHELLAARGVHPPFLLMNPAGGRNPGMVMDSKRWPPENFAQLADRLSAKIGVNHIVLVAGPGDEMLVSAVQSRLQMPSTAFVGELSFGQIAALANAARVYIGNDTGLTHLAAAAGAKTVMILGPSDPVRYAPFAPDSIALWKPAEVQQRGVTAGTPQRWDWERDGIGVDEAEEEIMKFLNREARD